MQILTGNFHYSESCAELLTKDLYQWRGLDLVYVELSPRHKENLVKVNTILVQHGLPQVEKITNAAMQNLFKFRFFEEQNWFIFREPRSTPLFHATVRALRDGQEFEFVLLDIIAGIEKENPHWISISGVEMFLMRYVHPRHYAEKLFKVLNTNFMPATKSLILLMAGQGQVIKDKLLGDQPTWVDAKVENSNLDQDMYYIFDCFRLKYKTLKAKYFRRAELQVCYPVIGGNHIGYVYFLGTDPTILDKREWLVK